MKKPHILGLITARGGSKRVPRKNIKEFLGKPLLAWSIETGKAAQVFDRFVLTTEDAEIAALGEKYGIEVPFMRPMEYAQDMSKSFDAVRHAYEWLRDNDNYAADYIILLEPTGLGRQPFHIREVTELIQKDEIDSLMGVSELAGVFHPHKVMEKKEGGILVRFHEGRLIRETEKRNQDYSKLFYTNSAIYAFKPRNFYGAHPGLWGDKVYGYVMDEKYAIDIDTPYDWQMAELKMKQLCHIPISSL